MSTDHYLYCQRCNKCINPSYNDSSLGDVLFLIGVKDKLLKFWKLKNDFPGMVEINITYNCLELIPDFFRFLENHKGHTLTPIDEYTADKRETYPWESRNETTE